MLENTIVQIGLEEYNGYFCYGVYYYGLFEMNSNLYQNYRHDLRNSSSIPPMG